MLIVSPHLYEREINKTDVAAAAAHICIKN